MTEIRHILYFDMDNVLVDFPSALSKVSDEEKEKYKDDGTGDPHYDDIPGIFKLMQPMPGAIEAVKALAARYDCYILSTAPWGNPSAWQDKVEWVKRYFDHTIAEKVLKGGETDHGNPFYKRMTLTHHKEQSLQPGAWLIDDRDGHGADMFVGHHIKFGEAPFSTWPDVVAFLTQTPQPEHI